MKGVFALLLTVSFAAHAQTLQTDRVLTQRIETRDDGFRVCASIRSNSSAFFLTTGFPYQLLRFFTDENGRPAVKDTGFVPSLPPPPPPPGAGVMRYSVIGLDESLEACRSYRYDEFSVDRIHVRTEFRSWLPRNEALEEPIQIIINRGAVARPLYSDEPLASNSCVIDRKARKATCG